LETCNLQPITMEGAGPNGAISYAMFAESIAKAGEALTPIMSRKKLALASAKSGADLGINC
jgi:hypothetical protein